MEHDKVFYHICKDKALISITGPDKLDFLQGILTQDVYKLNYQKGIYASVLNAQGRFLYDMFLTTIDEAIIIEIDSWYKEVFMKQLNMYKLRSKITIDDYEGLEVLCTNDPHAAPFKDFSLGAEVETSFKSVVAFVDPRHPDLGIRALVKPDHGKLSDLTFYIDFCADLGVPSFNYMFLPGTAIPLEIGLDDLNAIDWDKGCYIGQELTARTKYQGVIRKKLMAFTKLKKIPENRFNLIRPNVIQTNMPIYDENLEEVADVYLAGTNTLLAMCRLTKSVTTKLIWDNYYVRQYIKL